jgi:Tfp pilus assembly protein PilV
MKRRMQKGFTLLEIMVCITLLMVTVLAVMGVIASNAAVNNHAREQEIAVNIASQQMERVFRDLPQNVDTYNGDSFTINELSFSDGRPGQVTTEVAIIEDTPNLRRVVVVVRWDEDAKPVELQALRRTS